MKEFIIPGNPLSQNNESSPEDADAAEAFLKSLPELRKGERFRFACHPEVPCFNACCSDLSLMITPYDALRLRRALKISGGEFIRLYAVLAMAPDTGFPMLKLNMLDDERKSCPFVSKQGCRLYENRPGACRTYPLGRATRLDKDGQVEEQFFVVREDHCRGFEQESSWDSPSWLNDQGLEDYNRLNDRYMRLMATSQARGARLNQKQSQMAYLAQYNPDAFQNFITQTGIFERLEIDEERKQAVLTDEEACLEFGLDWLELALFGVEDRLRRKKP